MSASFFCWGRLRWDFRIIYTYTIAYFLLILAKIHSFFNIIQEI
jgi:hypothetical protein